MKIAIVGMGAMGSVYAALMCEAGHEVWGVDLWEDHINAINTQGLRLEGASGDRVISGINGCTDIAAAGRCDLYIIATKAQGVGAAARSISTLADDHSIIMTIQNGLGAGERISKYLPTDNVLLGVADGFGASLTSPGHGHHSAMNLIRIGEINGGMTPRLQQITGIWRAAGFNAKAFEDINQLIWEKFICNVSLSGPCTVFQSTLGELMANPDHWHIALGCALEVYQLGQRKGIQFSFADPIDYVTKFAQKMPGAKPSMLLDHEARRQSEIDAINGMAVSLGLQLGIPTPYNETLTSIIRHQEQGF